MDCRRCAIPFLHIASAAIFISGAWDNPHCHYPYLPFRHFVIGHSPIACHTHTAPYTPAQIRSPRRASCVPRESSHSASSGTTTPLYHIIVTTLRSSGFSSTQPRRSAHSVQMRSSQFSPITTAIMSRPPRSPLRSPPKVPPPSRRTGQAQCASFPVARRGKPRSAPYPRGWRCAPLPPTFH